MTFDYQQEWANLIEQYGDKHSVPREASSVLSETLRAYHVIEANPDANPASVLRQYGVATAIIERILGETPDDHQPRKRRADKYQAIIDWCHEHALEQTSAEALAEIGDVSYQTALKFINDRVDLFRKIKRGVYEVRDVKAERAAGL